MTQRPASLAVWLPASLVGAALGIALLRNAARLDHDCALYMACAARLLGGARPYLDLVEINPPLAWVVYGVPEIAARSLAPLGVHVSVAVHLVVVLYGALGLGLVWPLLAAPQRPAFLTAWMLVHLVAVIVPFRPYWLDAWVGMPLAQWGQREHLFLVAAVSWLAVRAARDSGVAVGGARAGAVGILAGVMASLKPHFLVSIVGVEVLATLLRRSTRGSRGSHPRSAMRFEPELVTLAAVPAIYLGQFLLWPGAWLRGLAHWTMLAARRYDLAYGSSWGHIVAHAWPTAVAVGAVWGLQQALARSAHGAESDAGRAANDPLVIRILLLATFGFAMAVLQHKGFPYHFLPAQGAAILVAGLLTTAARHADVWVRRAMAALVVGLAAFLLLLPPCPRAPWLESLETAIDRAGVKSGDAVMVMGDAVLGPWPTLRLRGLVPAGRFPWFFPLPLLQTLTPGPARETQEALLAADVAEDIAREPPAAIFVQVGKAQAFPDGFDLEQWLLGFPSTKRALSTFRPGHGNDWWRVYLRARPPAVPAR